MPYSNSHQDGTGCFLVPLLKGSLKSAGNPDKEKKKADKAAEVPDRAAKKLDKEGKNPDKAANKVDKAEGKPEVKRKSTKVSFSQLLCKTFAVLKQEDLLDCCGNGKRACLIAVEMAR